MTPPSRPSALKLFGDNERSGCHTVGAGRSIPDRRAVLLRPPRPGAHGRTLSRKRRRGTSWRHYLVDPERISPTCSSRAGAREARRADQDAPQRVAPTSTRSPRSSRTRRGSDLSSWDAGTAARRACYGLVCLPAREAYARQRVGQAQQRAMGTDTGHNLLGRPGQAARDLIPVLLLGRNQASQHQACWRASVASLPGYAGCHEAPSGDHLRSSPPGSSKMVPRGLVWHPSGDPARDADRRTQQALCLLTGLDDGRAEERNWRFSWGVPARAGCARCGAHRPVVVLPDPLTPA